MSPEARHAHTKLTLERDRCTQDPGEDEQKIALHRAPGRLSKVDLTQVKHVFDTADILRRRLRVQTRNDLVQVGGDVLSGLLLKHIDDLRVQELIWGRGTLVDREGVDVVRQVIHTAVPDGPNSVGCTVISNTRKDHADTYLRMFESIACE